jgi:hypothetical protein
MSEQSVQDFTDFDDLSKELNKGVEEHLAQNTMLNLKSFAEDQLNDLKDFKKARAEMVAKRDALNKAIAIAERRIEVAIAAVSSLQKPF